MALSEARVADLAIAVLDGTPIDWVAAESGADEADGPLLEQLRVMATLADFHRRLPLSQAAAAFAATHDTGEGLMHWGHLRVLERVGAGTFGQVYRAWDTRLDREVALKLLPAGRGARDGASSSIMHEGRLLARVRHPNVVIIHGAEQIGDEIGLWMEFVRGHTFEQILHQQTQLSAAETVDTGLALCSAVSAVHSAGVLHRDIKAHNVMRAEDARIVLMDFGTGRELDDDGSSDLAGTPLYLAPEVLTGQPATVRSDVYSLGVLLYRLVTGSFPVHARTVCEIRRAHECRERTNVRAARRAVPSRLARIIERAIDPQPERRYESADALAAALATVKRHAKLRSIARAIGVAAGLILVVGLGWQVLGWQVRWSPTPATLFAHLAGWTPGEASSAGPVERRIIAVLPFENLSVEPESDYFVDGLTDEIIRNLAVIDGLHVRSRTSSFAFKDKRRDLREVGERLGANLVVEGSVLRAGTKLRINTQLVQVAGDVPLWSDQFNVELKDIFAVQDQISRAIVNKLQLRLGGSQRRYDTNVEAYELYLKALGLVDWRGRYAQKAAELLEQVAGQDPTFAPAHAGLANTHALMSFPQGRTLSFETTHSIIRTAAVKALDLDPQLADAHAAMGWVYSRQRDWANAEKSFRRAIDLNPSLTQSYTGYSLSTLLPLGKHDEALRLLQVALKNDPLSLDVQREIGQVQLFAQRYDDAINTFRHLRTVEPDFTFVDMFLARSLTFAGQLPEAFAVLDEMKKVGRPAPHYRAHAYVLAGRRAEAEKLVAEEHELLARTKGSPYRLAVIYAALGDKDRTFEALEEMTVVEPHRVGFVLMAPEMALLRGDLRLAALRKRFNLPTQ